MPESITKYAVNSTLGTPKFKPLNEIIEQKTNIKIQNVMFTLDSHGKEKDFSIIMPIDKVDISKTIIINNSLLRPFQYVTSIGFEFVNSTSIKFTVWRSAWNDSDFPLDISLSLITIGGED